MRGARLFLDSGDPDEVLKWMEAGVIDGVTTNPTILRRLGVDDWETHVRDLAAKAHPLTVSVQVTATGHSAMVQEAVELAGWNDNVVVKLPVVEETGEPELRTIAAAAQMGVPVNATSCLSVGQAVLAAKAGARYVSLLWGRIGDEGGSPAEVVTAASGLLSRLETDAGILVGSIRNASDVAAALLAGADIVTVPPAVLDRMARHHCATATVAQFRADARSR